MSTNKTILHTSHTPTPTPQHIDFSRRGLDGFDFARHNATPLPGLENLLPNSAHTNAILQLLFYVPEVRAAVLQLQVRFFWGGALRVGCRWGFLFWGMRGGVVM